MTESSPSSTAVQFLRAATACRVRDLKQLTELGALVRGVSELIHALQKERGVTSIFLGSCGAQFRDALAERYAESTGCERAVMGHLTGIEAQLPSLNIGARFYTRVALAIHALEGLGELRSSIGSLRASAEAAVGAYCDVIAALLAVAFESADLAADPSTSRALLALVNFAQGKEFAGQERAAMGIGLSAGHLDDQQRRYLNRLEEAQQQAFRLFAEFANPREVSAFDDFSDLPASQEFNELRRRNLNEPVDASRAGLWYELATRRIDGMKVIEDQLNHALMALCASTLQRADAERISLQTIDRDSLKVTARIALLVTDLDPMDRFAMPVPLRPAMEVLEAQSKHIDLMQGELALARHALAERKTIERAKGLLMRSRRLSEAQAYELLRQTAMGQNKRMIDIAEAVISMADRLRR